MSVNPVKIEQKLREHAPEVEIHLEKLAVTRRQIGGH
jgi:hypothetical protein